MKRGSKAWLWALLLFFLVVAGIVALSVSSGEVDRLWLRAPGWSRAKLVGDTSARQPVAIALDTTGSIYLLALDQVDGSHRARVVALDRNAEIVWERSLETAISTPEQPQLIWDGQRLNLFWLDDYGLYAAQVASTGEVQAVARLLSGEMRVGSYAVAPDADGSMALWLGGTRREPGVYIKHFEDPAGAATLVDAEGLQPAIVYDDRGTLHAVWMTYPVEGNGSRFYYAAYEGGVHLPEQQVLLAEVPTRSDSTLQGPWLGLDGERADLLWMETIQSGRQAYQTDVQVISFPLGEPGSASEPRKIVVPGTDALAYEPFPEGELAAGQRVSVATEPDWAMVSPAEMAVNSTAAGETVVVFRADLRYQRDSVIGQIGTLFVQNGVPTSYQLLSFNPRFSYAPVVALDQSGQLYVTWIERQDVPGYDVYFASTAPDIRQALSALTGGDLARMTLDTFFGLLRGAVFFPVAALLWLVVPLLLLAVTWFFRRDSESLTDRAPLVSIALALLAYWGGKLVTLGLARTYVPFSAWLPVIPAWLAVPLQIGVPLLIAVVALAVAWIFVRRLESRSALLFVIIYVGVDSLLTMAIYGVLLFDAF